MEESPEEFMIYIENDRENPSSDGQKEVDELMDVEYNGEEKELDSRSVLRLKYTMTCIC